MHGLLRCNINASVHARAGGADVSLRDVTIARDGKRRLAGANDVTHRKRAEDFGRFWKCLLVETRHRTSGDETCLGGRRLIFACSRRPLWRVAHVLGGRRWKSQNRKVVPFPPYVEEPLNSKVIKKSFVPEQRSRYVFFEFRDSYVLCMYVMNVPCTFRIFMDMAMVHIDTDINAHTYTYINVCRITP